MALKIIDCQASPSGAGVGSTPVLITVFFSEDITATGATGATFTVFDPAGSPSKTQSGTGITYDPTSHAASFNITLTPQLVGERQILVSVTGISVDGVPEPPVAIGVVVQALTLVNCVATPDLVVVYFSTSLDPDSGPSDPNDLSNYTISIAGGPTIQPIGAYYDGSANVSATFLQLAAGQLEPGQVLTVTVSNVVTSPGGIPIGNNTFTTRVHGERGGGTGDGGRDGRRHAVKEITESAEDAVAYPILTEQVSFPPSAGPGPSLGGVIAAPTGASLGQTAAKAVTDVLGWKVNTSDPKGFIGALTQAFTLTQVEGHVEATWNPRTYAVQTDLGGGITGAQASLYTRAKDALDQSLQLLDGLYPLDPDADPEYVKALREMARSQMNAIVTELGTVGGPSVLRVNTYFGILLGTQQPISFGPIPPATIPTFDPDQITGTLGELRDTYGIYFQKDGANNPFSNSIEDEQDVTNFRVISDYMTSLLQSWISNGQFFVLSTSPTQPAFFGTQLVLISRQFSVIVETVSEVRFALDSVFIGPSERQTLLLQFLKFPAIFLEDMLQEIVDFFTVEGPGLLQSGGRISVTNNILPVVQNFQGMVREAKRPTNHKSLPDGYRTVRVQRSLDDLKDQLGEVINLVQQVGQQLPAPVQVPEPLQVLFFTPSGATLPGDPMPMTITIVGTGFQQGATCRFAFQSVGSSAGTQPKISVVGSLATENLLFAQLTITGGATGTYNYSVTVTNLTGLSSAAQTLFTVKVS